MLAQSMSSSDKAETAEAAMRLLRLRKTNLMSHGLNSRAAMQISPENYRGDSQSLAADKLASDIKTFADQREVSIVDTFGQLAFQNYTRREAQKEEPTLSLKELYAVAQALKCGYTIDKIHELSRIDKWFLHKINNIVYVGSENLH